MPSILHNEGDSRSQEQIKRSLEHIVSPKIIARNMTAERYRPNASNADSGLPAIYRKFFCDNSSQEQKSKEPESSAQPFTTKASATWQIEMNIAKQRTKIKHTKSVEEKFSPRSIVTESSQDHSNNR